MVINRGEKFSHYSHVAGAVRRNRGFRLFAAGTPGGIGGISRRICSSALAFITLFTFSALYHAFKKTENEINLWRKLDHIAIFIMIAGPIRL